MIDDVPLGPSIDLLWPRADSVSPILEREQTDATSGPSTGDLSVDVKPPSPPLRPLTSLKWPYVQEESAYPDPLKRDDPKPLQIHQYEAIGMYSSPAV